MKATMFYMAEKYCNVLLISIFGFYIAKILEPDVFGVFSHVEAVVVILSIFSMQGVDQVIQRDIINDPNSAQKIISSAFFVKLTISFFVVFSVIVIALNSEGGLFYQALIPFSFLIIFRSLLFISSILICDNRYKEFSIYGIIVVGISFVMKMVIISNYNNITLIAILYVFDTLFLVVLYAFFYIKKYGIKPEIDLSYCKKLISEGSVLALSGGMIIIYTKVDQLFIAELLGNKELADYSIAIKFINLFILGSTVFSLAFTSRLNKRLDGYNKNVKQLIFSSLFFGVLLGLISFILSPLLIDFLYSNKFLASKFYVLWLSAVIPLSYLLANVGRVLVSENLTGVIFKRNFGALCINIILNYFLIPLFGVYGAIFATIISYFFSSFLYLVINTKSRTLLLGLLK